jgi:predicted TIM-barrel fold metal-dependent hydrolase
MVNAELVIDVDTHVTEPPDTFVSRVPAKLKDRVPRVERTEEGKDHWFVGGEVFSSVGMTAVAGWPEPFPSGPSVFEEIHPAAYDSSERLKLMDEQGIWAQVLYPNVGGFGAQHFLKLKDRELMLACVQAYNNFQLDWISPDPRRFVAVISTPFWDIDDTVAEVTRCAELGHRAVLFTGEPQRFGLPLLGDPHWDPLWSVAQEAGLPISFHIGSGDTTTGFTPERMAAHGKPSTYAYASLEMFLKNGIQLTDLLGSGVLPRYPDLKFVSVESGIGFVPFVLEAVDHSFNECGGLDHAPNFEMLPSEYFRRQVYACYWFEETAPQRLLDKIGFDNVLFETDFPHPTCLYGNVRERIEASLAGHSEEVRRKLLWENAAALYRIEGPEEWG